MSEQKKVPLIALTILITVPVSITITYGITSGLFADFFGLNADEFPLINGTIVGTDNKTYQVLVSSNEQKPNLTLINTAVLDSQNKTFHVQIGPKQEPIPEPPTCPPDSKLNVTTGKCDPIVIPNPEPPIPPTTFNQTLKVAITADVEDGSAGNAVFNRIKTENPTNVFVLGDLGYDDNLAWFKSTYGTLGNKVNCVAGNHEWANEDGTTTLQAETLKYCGNNFYMKKGPHLFLFFNTNNLGTSATDAGKLLTNPTFMTGIKNVFIESHKGCAVPPNTHHPVEVKAWCDAVKAKIPTNVKQYWDSAHNHVMSASADGVYKQSGAGGRSHYECGTSSAFPFCNNSSYGYLIYTIKPDGTVNYQFKDYNGVVKYSK